MKENTYTLGTSEMVDHMIRELPDQYTMSLNPEDMRVLIMVLGAQAGFFYISEDMQARAVDIFSSIAETLGIEGI